MRRNRPARPVWSAGVLIRRAGLLAGVLLVTTLAACDTDDGRQMDPPTQEQRDRMPTTTSSTSTTLVLPGGPVITPPAGAVVPGTIGADTASSFVLTAPWPAGGAIDAQYTCDGAGLEPFVSWTTPPAGTVELALVVSDNDAEDFIHYAVAGIPPMAGQLGAGVVLPGSYAGTNDFGATGWGGPCPPQPGEGHTYRWTLYALAQQSELPEGFKGAELQSLAMETAFASTQSTGTYTRAG